MTAHPRPISPRRTAPLVVSALALLWALGAITGPAVAAGASHPRARAADLLRSSLDRSMRAAGPASGASVVDLTTGQPLYANRASVGRLPASVQKLWTTSTALLAFGPSARLTTSVLADGRLAGSTFHGTLYLRGGGDPSFGSAGFNRVNYGTGATVQALVSGVVGTLGLRSLDGSIVADESQFDDRRGTPATGYRANPEVEGSLSALVFNRDWADPYGQTLFPHPALQAGLQFAAALRAAGVRLGAGTPVRAGITPASAQPLAAVPSPAIADLVHLTNTPSDNFFAETLLKDLGARYGAGGTTPAGAAVVRSTIATTFHLRPRLDDGSGLSRYDRSSPQDVVSLLNQQQANPAFTSSLARAGETGTLRHELRGTAAQGRCRGKTGTLIDASNVVGYCRARDGHTLAYAFMMNSIDPLVAHPIQNAMELALVGYDG
ncbi:MAG: D-alanyl-D-alanine carboxypeptidase [Actinomycetota bacterium]|nr:D-alanyl-D-alanine carboxypeptidase [Actinomycetota bacterium]